MEQCGISQHFLHGEVLLRQARTERHQGEEGAQANSVAPEVSRAVGKEVCMTGILPLFVLMIAPMVLGLESIYRLDHKGGEPDERWATAAGDLHQRHASAL